MIPLLLLTASLSAQVPSHAIYASGRVLTLEACGQRLEVKPYPPAYSGSVILAIYDQCVPHIFSDWWPGEYMATATPSDRVSLLPTYLGIQVSRDWLASAKQGAAVIFSRWCYDAQRWRACQ